MSQVIRAVFKSWKKGEGKKGSPWEPPEKNTVLPHLDFSPLRPMLDLQSPEL